MIRDLIIGTVIALMFMSIALYASPPIETTPSDAEIEAEIDIDRACMANLQCWGNRHLFDAIVGSRPVIESHAPYQFEWTDGFLDTKFTAYSWVDRDKGIIKYHGDSLRFEDRDGSWKNMVYQVIYDPNAREVTSVQMYVGRLN